MYFITSIIGQQTLERLPQYKQLNSRTFGFYANHLEALVAINENRGNMEECLYDYIVLESIDEGIHPLVKSAEWWKWDTRIKAWIYIKDSPKEYEHITNWALG